jgi:Cd2+/Zn2+-exporting ATPase
MKPEHAAKTAPPAADPHCLIQAVADVMKEEPALEAVKIDRERRAISLATLGTPKRSDLEQVLTTQIRHIEQAPTGEHCDLLEGKKDCSTCTVPWASNERKNLTIRHDSNTTTIARVTCPTAPTFWRWRDIPWPKLVPREVLLPEDDGHEDEWKAQLAAAGLCAGFGLAGHFAAGSSLSIFFYIAAYFAGGWFTAGEVWERLQKGALDVHFLMLAVAVGSAGIGAWNEGATLLFLFSFSGALEHYAMGRTHREIRSLFKTAPKVATLLDAQGNEHALPVEQLEVGMKLLVKPGEQFPVDAEIIKGRTASDESNLTGEAAPVEKGVGDSVFAGTLNLWGGIEVAVLKPAGQSALQKIIQLIREAQHLKAPSQRFTDRFGTRYTYAILGLSVVMFFVWWLGFGYAPFASSSAGKSAFYRTMALLVVASPCALVLSIPSAVLAAIAWAARRGILFRGGAAVEKLAEIDVVAMDKTGTLTTGDLMVERVESFPPGREKEVAQLAYAMERLSTHPLARAITRFGKQRQLPILELEQFESVNGLGLRARYRNSVVKLGRREWLEGDGATDASSKRAGETGEAPASKWLSEAPPTEAGLSEVWLATGALMGRILLRDDIRPKARDVVLQLRELGLQTVVLTGDRQATAQFLKNHLDLDDVRAGLKPDEKVRVIESFIQNHRRVAMIGDGVNDAPSLAAAHVGVAMGARGSDAALEQAEVVLMHDRLENFLTAFRLSQRARHIIRQNLVISLGTVAVLVVFALLGSIPLTVGVIGHEGSTVVVVLNSLRLLVGSPRS